MAADPAWFEPCELVVSEAASLPGEAGAAALPARLGPTHEGKENL